MKHIYVLALSMALSCAASAQWAGPTNGTLSTTNNVHLNYTRTLGAFNPSAPPPPPSYFFALNFNDGANTEPSLRVSDNNGQVEIGKTLRLINGATLFMTRSNNTNVLQVDAFGRMRLTTDGFANSSRGFFVNNGSVDFFSITPSNMLYSGNFTLKGDLIIKDNADVIQYRLYQDGLIRAREVKVDLSTIPPDYVFEPNYKLMPMNELEIYLRKFKHLPNISSANEMAASGGIKVGEMQLKLLEKVEELTLYLLQLNTEITCLKKQIAQLEQQ
jgi:hypothetical protein